MPTLSPDLRLGVDARSCTDAFPGVGRSVEELLVALCRKDLGDRLAVLLPKEGLRRGGRLGDEDDLVQVLERSDATTTVARRSPLNRWAASELRSWARVEGLDVVHALFPLSAGATPCPLVVTWHDTIPLSHPQSMPGWGRRAAFRWLARRALRSASQVVTPSRASRDELHARFRLGRRPVDVVPHAPSRRFVGGASAAPPTNGSGELVVLSVIGAKAHKNLDGLLAAWRQVVAAGGARCRLDLVVPPSFREPHLEADLAATVRWYRGLDDAELGRRYRAAAIYVHPAHIEGYGLPVIEAMASGVAVACSRAPGLLETVGDPDNALLFPSRSVEEIASSLLRLLSDEALRKDLAARGERRTQSLDWSAIADRMLEIYDRAAFAGPSR